jgi:hypothetical protein
MAGEPQKLGIEDPFSVLTGTAVSTADIPYVFAPAPNGVDDFTVLQDLMDANCPFGFGVRLRYGYGANAYLTSVELQHKANYQASIIGAGASFNPGGGVVNGGTEIRAIAPMRSVVAYLADVSGQETGGFVANANQQATSGIYWSKFGFSDARAIVAINALYDGHYIDGDSAHFVDASRFTNCGGISNGKTYATAGVQAEYLFGRKGTIAGTAQVTAGTTIVLTGAPDLTALIPTIRKGDPVRVGAGAAQALSALSSASTVATATTATPHGLSDRQVVTIAGCTPSAYNGSYDITRTSDTQFTYNFVGAGVVTVLGTVRDPSTAQYAQIESCTATTITLQANPRNGMTVTAAGQEYSFGCGNGWHDNRTIGGSQPGANSNSNKIDGGVWYSNGGSDIFIAGLFGTTIDGPPLIGFSSWYGLVLGHSDNAIVVNNFAATALYFESTMAGSIWFGQVVDPFIGTVTWANKVIRHRGVYSNPGWIFSGVMEHIQWGVLQNFAIDLDGNDGVTLRHRIIGDWQNGAAAAAADAINGQTSAYTATPSVSNVVGFAAGGGIVAADPAVFILDVSAQVLFKGQWTIEQPGAGVVGVYAYLNSFSVNGVTRMRLGFKAVDAANAGIALSAASIGAGKHLVVRFDGFVKKS